MSTIDKIKVKNVIYDISADYSNIENTPTFKTINNQSILGTGNINIEGGGNETDPTVPNHVKNITQNDIESWNNKSNFSGNYNDLINKPSEVTETTVSNWGFTKNTGTYSKPSGGIPKTDLAASVQTSLEKADTALQSETYTGTITGITMNGVSKGTSGVVDLGTVITEHQDLTDYELKPAIVSLAETAVSITPEDNKIYKCGTLTSLTITNPPVTGAYSIVFTSGSTATTTVIPTTLLGLESFVSEANTIYEINVLDNRAVVGSWVVSA